MRSRIRPLPASLARAPARAAALALLASLASLALAAEVITGASKRDWSHQKLMALGPLVEASTRDTGLSGGLFLLWHKGRLIFQSTRGMADVAKGKAWQRNSLARIFSMTKPVTAVAVMQLVDDGKILLTDDLADYLPEFAAPQVVTGVAGVEFLTEPAKRPIKVRDLLTHMAGLTYHFLPTPLASAYTEMGIQPGDNRPGEGKVQPSLEAMVRDVATLPLVNHPGESWHYSIGLDVAGRLVEVVSGMAFDEYLQERIFAPLGMTDTTFYTRDQNQLDRLVPLYARPKPDAAYIPLDLADGETPSAWAARPAVISGGGGLLSTPDDYGRFMLMLLGGGQHQGTRVLSASSTRLLMSDHSSPGYGQTPDKWNTYSEFLLGDEHGQGYGLGGLVITSPARSGQPTSAGSYSWGGAASTFFWVDPEKQLAGAFFTQLLPLFDLGQDAPPEGEAAPEPKRVIDQLRPRLINMVYAALEN